MLSLETCTRLKEAGFPQQPRQWGLNLYYTARGARRRVRGDASPEPYDLFIPQLSDLIEAVGAEFFSLIHVAGRYTANTRRVGTLSHDSPEEAVADLYLKLHPSNP